VPALRRLDLPDDTARECARLLEVAEGLAAKLPGLAVTIDPVEKRGTDYEIGIGFTFFASGVAGELGRGGRYATDTSEPATGFTLYTDTILLAEPVQPAARRLFVPTGTPAATARRCRDDGWITVPDLASAGDAIAEAVRLRCTYCLSGDEIVAVG
jgi:ATP phosphoribosyltransferase regulatory subunit